VVEEGFLAGRNHPDDIANMIFLFRWFRNVGFVARPIDAWAAADVYIEALAELGDAIQEEHRAGAIRADRQKELLAQIAAINARLTPLAQEFSAGLAAGARRLTRLLPEVILGFTATLLAAGVAISLLLARRLREGILRLREGALRVARGDFSLSIGVRSQDELGDLAVAFNEMTEQRRQAEAQLAKARDEALQASRAKSDFLSSMSHEIRTPLNSVIGLTDLLWETPLAEEQRGYVRRLANAGATLVTLISDILDLSRIESGRLELEEIEFDVRDLVEKNAEVFAIHAREKGLELRSEVAAEVPKRLLGDPGRLRQVVANLVGNAIKFTERGQIVVRIETEPAGPDGRLRISVSDTGIGIPSDRLEAIFESFTQAETSTSRHYGGTGLGLAICRRLVERMGGRISAQSRVGEGSTFAFTVSFRVPREGRVVTPIPVARESELVRLAAVPKRAPLRVLLAEDSEDNRMLIQTYFRRTADVLEIAENGRTALEKFKSGHFDVVLMDMQMPVMNGYDATRAIREWEAGEGRAAVPIIALTAYAMKEERERSLQAGCTLYLTKPIKKGTLMDAVYGAARRVEGETRTG
jgi:signal transduction histidine kinase/ActR/RegA family two-component response regulator